MVAAGDLVFIGITDRRASRALPKVSPSPSLNFQAKKIPLRTMKHEVTFIKKIQFLTAILKFTVKTSGVNPGYLFTTFITN